MIALVVVSTFVVLVLGILVAGLLRSHADILRSLHQLGAGVGDPALAEGTATTASGAVTVGGGATGPAGTAGREPAPRLLHRRWRA